MHRAGAAVCGLVLIAVGRLWAAGPDTALVDAVERRDHATVQALLRRHVDVNTPQGDGATAIAWAAHWDDQQTIALLIRAGADVNAANELGVTPLMLACTNASAVAVDMLLKAGANPNAALPTGETPLFTAARTGSVEVVRHLLNRGSDVNAETRKLKQTPLMWALASGHSDVAALLIASGANIRTRSAGGSTPLLFAAQQGDTQSMAVLLAAGADLREATADGTNALHIAAASGHTPLAMFLLERGMPPDAAGPGYTALHAAVFRGNVELATSLLARGANPNARLTQVPSSVFGYFHFRLFVPPAGATPLWLAAKPVNLGLMRLLMAAGADPRIPADDQTTPFMVAAGVDQPEQGARGEATAYFLTWDEERALQALPLFGVAPVDINARSRTGRTALHGAANVGASRIVRFLVANGARLDAQDADGQTPFRLAQGHNGGSASFFLFPETAALLSELGADTTLGVDARKSTFGQKVK